MWQHESGILDTVPIKGRTVSVKFDLNIETIKNFIVVAEMGNITNASERLYITQPTLSRQISSLEETLNVTLLERAKNGVALTEAGETFYQECKEFVRAYDNFLSHAFEFQNIVVGTLNIAYQKSCEEKVIGFHSEFLRTYPNVVIKNFRQDNNNFINQLISGKLDAAYLYGRELRHSYKNIKSLQIGVLHNMLLVSRDNPLSQRERVHLSELKDERFILPSKSNSPYKAAEIVKACESYGFIPQSMASADAMIDYLLGVVRFKGVTILPYMHNIEESAQVKYIELDGYEEQYPIHIAWNESNTNPALSTYLKFIQRQLVTSG